MNRKSQKVIRKGNVLWGNPLLKTPDGQNVFLCEICVFTFSYAGLRASLGLGDVHHFEILIPVRMFLTLMKALWV